MSDQVQNLLRRILGVEVDGTVPPTELDGRTVRTTVVTAFALALEMRFGESVTVDDVQAFVARIRGRWVEADALNPVLAEHIILSTYDESDLLGSVPAVEIAQAQNLLTYGLVKDLEMTSEAIDDFIREVTDLVTAPADQDG